MVGSFARLALPGSGAGERPTGGDFLRRRFARSVNPIVVLALFALSAACGTQSAGIEQPESAQQQRSPDVISQDVNWSQHNDTSPPLFLLQPAERKSRLEEHEVKMLPAPRPYRGPAQTPQHAVQTSIPSLLAPTVGVNFDGLGTRPAPRSWSPPRPRLTSRSRRRPRRGPSTKVSP